MKLTITRRRVIALGMALSLLLIWLLWPDRSLAKVRALRAQLSSDAGKSLPPEEREAKARELRAAMQALSPEQRGELFAEFRQRNIAEMERYLTLSPAEKRQELDRQIDRMEQMRQRMQQQPGGANGQRPAGLGGPGGFGAGPGGPGGQNRLNTPEDRERRRQQRLDNSTPRERELRDLYRRDLEQRRRERGLPPTPTFPGRPR